MKNVKTKGGRIMECKVSQWVTDIGTIGLLVVFAVFAITACYALYKFMKD